MTLSELNWHFELRDKLARAQETLAVLREKAYPGATALTGMPHTPGVSDKVGNLAAEIADTEEYIRYIEEEIAANEGVILAFIQGIEDVQIRIIFRLRFIRGLTWKEVSQVLGSYTTEKSVSELCYKFLRSVESGGIERNAEESRGTERN